MVDDQRLTGLRATTSGLDQRTNDLVEALLDGDQLALARLITLVENRSQMVPAILAKVFPSTGRARLIGVTGAPGAGKSTLVDRLISGCRDGGGRVGVLAIDPSSPYTGGAILGDRVRMQKWATDPGVFIRSLATRGHLGGLSLATRDAARLLDACGYKTILIETVGTGQSEVDIMDLAHTIILVMAPGAGDEVQAQKAGILEIADILVVNKADREGANQLVGQLQAMLDLAGELAWRPPVIKTVAGTGEGIEDLLAACRAHQEWLGQSERSEQRLLERAGRELAELVGRMAAERAIEAAREAGLWEDLTAGVATRRLDPYSAAAALLAVLEVRESPDGPARPSV